MNLGVGLALAFGGVGLITLGTSPGGDRDVLGVLLCLLSAVSYSISLILQKPLVGRLPAVHVTWLACSVGAVACLPFSGELISDVGTAPWPATVNMVYLGVFPTAIAFTTWAYALSRTTAGKMGATTYAAPALVVLMSWVLLDELPALLAIVGAVSLGITALVLDRVLRRSRPGTVLRQVEG